jgi:hypothetical protein
MLVPAELGAIARKRGLMVARRRRTAYLIRNARLDPNWASVERRTFSIMQRALVSLIQSQGVGDIWQLYALAQRDDVDFNLAFIGRDFSVPSRHEFDSVYMKGLFEYGYQAAAKGYSWHKCPPGYESAMD